MVPQPILYKKNVKFILFCVTLLFAICDLHNCMVGFEGLLDFEGGQREKWPKHAKI